MASASISVRRMVLAQQVPEEVNPNLYLLSGSPTMEDLDRPMTISEGQLKQASLRNWQGAPLHVSSSLVFSVQVTDARGAVVIQTHEH